ncbi:hypothetical protein AALP_AA7G029300 [Arabis alpina]|uniref:Uncharacterized protein n=1 Tax=Arabis alpina TaxID=50452 RepID=A0A087GFL0_ARAAL|nr:hypothetical protein AALP_AA7G029300 [Arabis alpina]
MKKARLYLQIITIIIVLTLLSSPFKIVDAKNVRPICSQKLPGCVDIFFERFRFGPPVPAGCCDKWKKEIPCLCAFFSSKGSVNFMAGNRILRECEIPVSTCPK